MPNNRNFNNALTAIRLSFSRRGLRIHPDRVDACTHRHAHTVQNWAYTRPQLIMVDELVTQRQPAATATATMFSYQGVCDLSRAAALVLSEPLSRFHNIS